MKCTTQRGAAIPSQIVDEFIGMNDEILTATKDQSNRWRQSREKEKISIKSSYCQYESKMGNLQIVLSTFRKIRRCRTANNSSQLDCRTNWRKSSSVSGFMPMNGKASAIFTEKKTANLWRVRKTNWKVAPLCDSLLLMVRSSASNWTFSIAFTKPYAAADKFH